MVKDEGWLFGSERGVGFVIPFRQQFKGQGVSTHCSVSGVGNIRYPSRPGFSWWTHRSTLVWTIRLSGSWIWGSMVRMSVLASRN